jgi:hypothetical protein
VVSGSERKLCSSEPAVDGVETQSADQRCGVDFRLGVVTGYRQGGAVGDAEGAGQLREVVGQDVC